MPMLKKTVPALVATALALGLPACGEDRSGDVKFQGDTGTNTSTTGTETTGTETTGTTTSP